MTKQTLVGILITIVVVVLSNSLFVIRETQRGVLLKFGGLGWEASTEGGGTRLACHRNGCVGKP